MYYWTWSLYFSWSICFLRWPFKPKLSISQCGFCSLSYSSEQIWSTETVSCFLISTLKIIDQQSSASSFYHFSGGISFFLTFLFHNCLDLSPGRDCVFFPKFLLHQVSRMSNFLIAVINIGFQVWREKNILKPAPGKRRCNCRNEVYHKQIGPGMFQQMTEQVCVLV